MEIYIKDERGEKHMVKAVYVFKDGAPVHIGGARMRHKTLVNGMAYEVKGGKCLVNGTVYSIKKGRTLINGTGYDIKFQKTPSSTLKEFDTPAFTSNGNKYSVFKIYGWEWIKPGIYYDNTRVNDGYGFTDEAYRTITFDEAPTGDLLAWLQANAVQQ